ncbi:uncharacterized protein N7506_001831 [Penicillium brevicompactum]|uniref:uncharacterized protein n=1 Tax=Penicillium brevicompactum TaxID=5074 RepID=UPI00253FE761|nr:uncharacterized protein N7506_001831 [Penicillium brevicompactum]KAJ5348578.1 hypothetical protein N7506_001831 [Penicillium brevicompactum]
MAPLPPNPDTIIYPPEDPQLIISVAQYTRNYPLNAVSLDVYVEKFLLGDHVEPINKHNKTPSRLGIFATQFSIPPRNDDDPRLNVGVPGGGGGKYVDNPTKPQDTYLVNDGYRGGVLGFFAEELDEQTAKGLRFNVCGGAGYSPDDIADAEHGAAGGNGGAGGDIAIVYTSVATAPVSLAQTLLTDLAKSEIKFPDDFDQRTSDLIGMCNSDKVHTVPRSQLDKLKQSLKGPQSAFEEVLVNVVFALKILDKSVYSALTQTAGVTGGYGGRGSRGSKENGADGRPGVDGKYRIQSATDVETIWNNNLCFVHPVQCRMLLDMAKLHYYVDGADDLAKSKDFLERLVSRLQFLDFEPPGTASSETNLVKAYRDAEPRLFIPSGPETKEPASIQSLRAIKMEATAVLAMFNSGKDFYGNDRNRVPRGSFKSFEQTIDKELKAVKEAETTYNAYLEAANEAAKKGYYINHSRTASESAKASNNAMIKNAKDDLADNIFKIHTFTEPMQAASMSLQDAAKNIMVKIKYGFNVQAAQIFEAIGQIIMVPGMGKLGMAQLQGVSLLHQGLTEIPGDAGVSVNKDYLIKQVQNISGNLDSLYEAYKVSKDGTIDLLDPGAAKLQITEEHLNALLSEYENALPPDTLSKLKAKFRTYVDLVIKRNAAVLRYNAALVVIAKAVTENAGLDQAQSNISQMEKVSFGMDNPMMTVAMKNAYLTAVKQLQSWLYHAQRAYNFAALNSNNILASYFNTIDTSQYTYGQLSAAYTTLDDAHTSYIQAQKKAAVPFPTIRYELPESDFRLIQASGTDGPSCPVTIPTPDGDCDHHPSPFVDMMDIRLTKVRLFLPGAKTKNKYLHITLRHMGEETIADTKDKEITFTHETVAVLFRYNILTKQYEGPGTLPGIIGRLDDDDDYALVGPFAVWQIDIEPEKNEDLDLSEITSAYMEFEGSYRPLA